MGKRKARRLAAMGASRRFKLDLFADPSGDLSVQEGATDNLNHGGETGVPDSPTSGKKENPLSLLSQYTDEDSDEEEMERSSDGTREGSVPNGQITENTVETGNAGNSLQDIPPATIKDLEHGNDQIENISKEGEVTGNEHLATENQITQSSSCEPVMQTISDAGGDWKVVMHAETKQCYYWNTLTGETSWEVPAVSVYAVPNEVAASDNATCAEAGRGVSELVEPGSLPLECQMSGFEDTGFPAKSCVTATEEDKGVNGGTAFSEDFDPDKLVKYGEDLLERLKLLDGSSTQIGKIKEEIEIRTSDCKELKPYGMSLFPFWLHTQSKLSHLEASIKYAELSLATSTPDSIEEEAVKETYATLSSFGNSNQEPENGEEEKEKEEKEMEKGQEENGKEEEKEMEKEQEENGREKEENEMEKEQEEKKKEKEREREKEEVREEETMLPIEDVEMEIDEESIVTDVANPDSELPLTSLEEGEIPPLPLPLPDDWAPPPPPPEDEPVPPPPEDELVPPPPPEEPSVSYSVVETIPPYQNYMAVPPYDYSVPAGYTQPHYYEAYYTASAQVSVPVLGTVAQAVPVTNSMVEVYNYPVPAGQRAAEISNKPECSVSAYHTGSYVGTINEILVPSASQEVGSIHVSGSSSVSGSSAAASSAAVSSIAVSSAVASSATIPSAAATSSAAPPAVSKDQLKVVKSKKRSIAVAPTLRSNKKVASLVNKWKAAKEELDGDDDDDEPESAYEVLERKRKKAIEAWRLHQIASGEAQGNANFVPLGGDWRERVKRKRAIKETKMERSPDTSSDATTAAATVIETEKQEVQGQPDLGQLSIGLPSGWQAYWDESSKLVYYGNASTSETTWVRPI